MFVSTHGRGYASGGSRGRSASGRARAGVPLKSKKPFRRYATVSRFRPSITPTFTETYLASAAGGVAPNTGGVIAPFIQNVPEYANYARLYRSFRITKMQVLFLNSVQTNATTAPTVPPGVVQSIARIALAADRSSIVTAPASELDVLNDDRCVVKQMDKLVSYTVLNPVPNLTMNIPPGTAAQAGVSLGPGNWLSWDDAGTVPHNGLSYWISGTGGLQFTNIYVKLTFQCCDPQ